MALLVCCWRGKFSHYRHQRNWSLLPAQTANAEPCRPTALMSDNKKHKRIISYHIVIKFYSQASSIRFFLVNQILGKVRGNRHFWKSAFLSLVRVVNEVGWRGRDPFKPSPLCFLINIIIKFRNLIVDNILFKEVVNRDGKYERINNKDQPFQRVLQGPWTPFFYSLQNY